MCPREIMEARNRRLQYMVSRPGPITIVCCHLLAAHIAEVATKQCFFTISEGNKRENYKLYVSHVFMLSRDSRQPDDKGGRLLSKEGHHTSSRYQTVLVYVVRFTSMHLIRVKLRESDICISQHSTSWRASNLIISTSLS